MLTRIEWVEKYYPLAKRLTQGTGIFPQIMIATAVIESQAKVNGTYYPGQNLLAKKYYNYFGIKADKNWTGKEILLSTKEMVDSQITEVQDTFRVYNSLEDSFKDYIKFLKGNPRYEQYKVFDAETMEQQAARLQDAGYATGKHYASLLVAVAKRVKGVALDHPMAVYFILGIIIYSFGRNA